MEDNIGFASSVQNNTSYLPDPKFKLLKAEEVEMAVGLGPDTFHLDDLLEFSYDDIGGLIKGSLISDQSVESAYTREKGDVVAHEHSEAKPITLSHKVSNQGQEEKDLRLDDDFAQIDWLSNIVDDSCCTNENFEFDYSQDLLLSFDMQSFHAMNAPANQFEMISPVSVPGNSATSGSADSLSWEISLPGRARSKRSRSGSKMWSSGVTSSSSQDRHQSESHADSFLSFECSDLSVDSSRFRISGAELDLKKPSKPWRGRKLLQDGLQTRKCAHCMTQRTPQWRAGPAGPKTLCNACGVRYKSGRLLPEYRPALSPTFQSNVHSNSHRKVVEMRRQKEMGFTQQEILLHP